MSCWKYKPMFDVQWREPYRFTRALNKLGEKTTRWWTRPFWALANSGPLLAMCLLIKPDSGKARVGFHTMLLLSLGGGFLITYFVSFVHYIATRTIAFGPKAIVSILGQQITHWPYEHIRDVRFESRRFGEKDFKIMVVTMKNRSQLVAAVPDRIKIQEVIDYLKNNGIKAA